MQHFSKWTRPLRSSHVYTITGVVYTSFYDRSSHPSFANMERARVIQRTTSLLRAGMFGLATIGVAETWINLTK